MSKRNLLVGLGLLVMIFVLASCSPATTPTEAPAAPTEIPAPPTNTPLSPTNTPVPPTATPVPPTDTPVPPTATPVPEAPPATVSDTVANLISEKCADCHQALPDSHTGDQNIGQCGLCHVPYGHAETPAHTAETTGCPLCHNSPAVTHFFLRDEEDQTVLAGNAEDKCIACHRDGGKQPDGRGVPALQTNEDILAAMQNGTLRQWVQPGGFMAKYLTDDEVATLTTWIDETSADRPLGYDPYLDAAKIDEDFDINGLGDNPAWDQATEHVISLTPTIYTASDEMKLKALYSNDYLYIRAEWPDSTASLTRGGSWLMDEGQWRHPAAATENDKQSEDRASFIWNISTPNYRDRYGCAIKCHGNVPGSSEFTDTESATMDIWHSKAARSLGLYSATNEEGLVVDTASEAFEVTGGTVSFSGVVDDKRLVWYMDIDDGYDLEDSGRRGDAGGGAYSHNRNGDKSGPLFIETAPESWADAMVLTKVETEDGSVIVADPTDPAYDAEAVAAAWANYAALGAVVPERILKQPGGSRADVLHSATWSDGVWVNEFRRALVTGNPDDVQFDLANATEYDYSVAVFDNCGRGEIPPGHTTYGDGQYQILRFQ